MKPARYTILADQSTPDFLVIKDLGPWDEHKTVTTEAENVVQELYEAGYLPEGRKLFYYDSEEKIGQLIIGDNGRFLGFSPDDPDYRRGNRETRV